MVKRSSEDIQGQGNPLEAEMVSEIGPSLGEGNTLADAPIPSYYHVSTFQLCMYGI